jgi:hypothetical protein
MWDCYGLEVCCDVTKAQQRAMWEQLRSKLPSESGIPSLGHLALRARYNPQRNYEIYTVEAVEGITADDIREMFETDPQSAAETIRRLGNCFYSDRVDPSQRVIV